MRRRRGSKIGKVFMILVCVAGFISLFSFIVMKLWNAVLPDVLHVTPVSFWQAMGILVLSKLLFGGFGPWGRGRNGKHEFKKKLQEKWKGMSNEEREEFRASMRARWKNWCRPEKDRDQAMRDPRFFREEPGNE